MRDDSRDRLLVPLMVPLLSILVLAVVILAFSRILLAVPHTMATPIALAMALNVLTAGALIASVPRLRGKLLGVVLAGAMIFMVGGGVVAMAVSGELTELRHALFAEEEPKHEEAAPPAEGESPAPAESPAEGEEPGPVGEATTKIVAANVAFDLSEMSFKAGEEATLTFQNDDTVPHNVAIYVSQGGEALFQGEVFAGPDARDYAIPAMDAGSYYFQCDLHPNMNGTVTVG